MSRFKIASDFLLDEKPIKILSGAIHYFRMPKEDWYHSLYNLKALGFNTVETYVPWNFHETVEGQFDFEGHKDVGTFLKTAQDLGLYAIVRPSPFICAEWEFGGLPAWLLNDRNMRIRSRDPKYLEKVRTYFHELFKILTPLQIDNGGPIIMMQIENEYGSFGEDHEYLNAIKRMMEDEGVTVPFATSDGSWAQCLRAGSMIEDNVLPTGNFGSRTKENFKNLKAFHQEYGKDWPLMCMEFWDGWFNRWGEDIIKRDGDDLANEVRDAVALGSVNLYMFHGGTNFGFWNGCSARGTKDLPQVTSYDYHAPLDETGNPNDKYFALQKMLKEALPDIEQFEPKVKTFMEHKSIPLSGKVSLFEILEDISHKTTSFYPQTMEEAGSGYGYMLYRTSIKKETATENFRIVDARDRVHFFIDQKLKYQAYQEEIGDKFEVTLEGDATADILVENMGRVNYGYKLLAPTQRKGLGQGLMQDLHFVQNWEQFDIDFDLLKESHFEKGWSEEQPAFYKYTFNLEALDNTHIDMSQFGKGIVLVNGFNIGRYWNVGPTQSLYIPKAFLKEGQNEIIVFDTEGVYSDSIDLLKEAQFSN
ncbi:glycoside hydrolase family 35 protein [Staphylococcus felis]|uniref:glycoside hydrolase family 35 protein n=1 Tax=Staphylococcus felis TaxID=46127 RepID=UPI000CD30C2B|nr:beta-galactosidase family protein [Staphylococcus felis]AVP35957.1 beta-galactosidase [Staphylococcus felis]PNZ35557.1 beta-galactosidase [Staphylococcus felis]QQB04071.1 beta-galactosidase [Staphylococcus felis]